MLKSVFQYTIVVALLLTTIWSQSWLLSGMLVLLCLYFWSPAIFALFPKLKLSSIASKLSEWVIAIALSVFFLWFINSYFLNFYTIKASSMLPAFDNNELIIINKLAYGPASHPNSCNDYRRLHGYAKMRQGDIIAFYFPEGDTSFVDYQNENYYFIKRQFETTRDYNPLLDGEVKANDVTQRQVYIKRLIALPGDTLRINNGDYYINNQACAFNDVTIARYELNKGIAQHYKEQMLQLATTSYRENGSQLIEIQPSVVKAKNWEQYLSKIEDVMNMPNTYVFPFKANYLWNASWLGPFIMPTKGKTVRLTLTNLPLYKRIIEAYEENTLNITEGQIFINGKKTTEYTFRMNYYWVGGDNKKHSFDSRYWGFVPENHIIGRVEKL